MGTETSRRHTLTLQSGPEASGDASEWARELAGRAGLPDDRTYALDLCLVELVSNIVDHAYRGEPGEIDLELDLGGEGAVLKVLDRGPAFDPLSVPPPPVPKSIEEAQIGGYGIHLVRSSASGCRYERRDGRNAFTAWFGPTSAAGARS